MKTLSDDFTENEEATQRKPAELYHIWRENGDVWRYTSGDIGVIYDGNAYTPATISRGAVKYDLTLDITTMALNVSYLSNPAIEYLSINPIEILWIAVMKLHRDQSPLEVDYVFTGQIKNCKFQGVKAQATCVGFEHFLKKSIPSWRYQLTCNHKVFDDLCTLDKDDYVTETIVAVSSSGLQYTSVDFGLQDDGFFIGGEVISGDESRTITNHSGNIITVMYKMSNIVNGDTVFAYPGCDGRAETCRDKYSNILNFLGFPFIPVENPAVRVTW